MTKRSVELENIPKELSYNRSALDLAVTVHLSKSLFCIELAKSLAEYHLKNRSNDSISFKAFTELAVVLTAVPKEERELMRQLTLFWKETKPLKDT